MVANHKLHDARMRVARGLIRIADLAEAIDASRTLREANVQDLFIEDSPESPLVVDMELDKEYRTQDAALKRTLASYASDAELRASMVPWMVDFEGTAAPSWTFEQRMPTDEELNSSAMAIYDELPRSVREWIDKQGFKITDSGAGSEGWHLGVPCTDSESDLLCRLAHAELVKSIEAGVLVVGIKFWGWRFVDLYNVQEAKNFLAKYSVS